MTNRRRGANEVNADPQGQEAIDALLCALIDGELAAGEAARLRARLDVEPELAARHAELAGVSDALRVLTAEPVTNEQLVELRAGLEQRLIDDAASGQGVGSELDARSRAEVIPLARGRARWALPLAAALAASLTLYLAADREPVLDGDAPAPHLVDSGDLAPAGALRLADEPDPGPDTFDATSDEDLAIGMNYDVLADYEVIAELDILEAIAGLDTAELEKTEAM